IISTLNTNVSDELLAGSVDPGGCYVLPNGSNVWNPASLTDFNQSSYMVWSFCLDSKDRVMASVKGAGVVHSTDGGRNYIRLRNNLSQYGQTRVLAKNVNTN